MSLSKATNYTTITDIVKASVAILQ